MSTIESPLQAVSESHLPRHMKHNGESGSEIHLEEWIEEQVRVACKAIFELLKSPRPMNENDQLTGPHVSSEDEGTAYHLLMVHNKGMFHAMDSYREVTSHTEVHLILEDWLDHFGSLFNIMCKQNQIPYERSADYIHSFQCRLVEHVQHLRRIYEQHSYGIILKSSDAWKRLDWDNPIQITEDGVDFLRQSVHLPHVLGEGEDTELVLNEIQNTRESLMIRLSPYGFRQENR